MINTQNNTTLIEKYSTYLEAPKNLQIISLGEGSTPFVRLNNLAKILGRPDLKIYSKLEGLNPSGSFKDRGMTMAISYAVTEGSQAVICASTGNTSASAAAFAAKAGIKSYVLLPAGKVALGKLAQAILYGAQIIQIDGNFDQALKLVKLLSENFPLSIVNSINPHRIIGQQTAAFEIVESLGASAPDYVCIPVGNAGNISAYWRGFQLLHKLKKIASKPKMCGFQAAGAAPFIEGKIIENPETIATAIRIGNPASFIEAKTAISESGGQIQACTDNEIIESYKLIASSEGIFCEPASAISIAGLKKLIEQKNIPLNSTIACILTGNGLKDPDTALSTYKLNLKPVAPELKELQKAMGI